MGFEDYILIQSANEDRSTIDVQDWIYYLSNKNVIRLNDSIAINGFKMEISNDFNSLNFESENNNLFNSYGMDSFWYRRGVLNFKANPCLPATPEIIQSISNNSSKENEFVLASVNDLISSVKNRVNSYSENDTNKLSNLLRAAEVGLLIPHTLITNKISDVETFVETHVKIITKPIDFNRIRYLMDEKFLIEVISTTKVLYADDVNKQCNLYRGIGLLPKVSLYQQYIDKKFELRIFYIDGQCYSMAIFSQSNEKTKDDFRNYDYDRPNRTVPYELPDDVSDKLRDFMKSINVNCGSIDMIYTHDGHYVFLEVNPVGQFQWLSKQCNFDIERRLAFKLLQNGN